MINSPDITILMALYNCENYVKEQVESLFNQSYKNWKLIIRDDCSNDNAVNIIKKYETEYPDKIKIIEGTENIGACQNFNKLLECSHSDYIMFCDCDDFWMPQKIEVTLKHMIKTESIYGSDTPILVHTDIKVADKDLNILSESLWNYQNIDPEKGLTLNTLLIRNTITGCTIMINKKLMELALPIPKETIMHDWWLALVAATFGKISFIKEPTILYRQHGMNDIGAKDWGLKYILGIFNQSQYIKSRLLEKQKQANAFLNRFKKYLKEKDLFLLNIFSDFNKYSFLKRRYYFIKYKFFDIGIFRNLGMFLYL